METWLNRLKLVLLVALIPLGYQWHKQHKEIMTLRTQNGVLESDLKAKNTISGRELTQVYREGDKVRTVIRYVPSEGSVIEQYKNDISSLEAQLEVANDALKEAKTEEERQIIIEKVAELEKKKMPSFIVKNKGLTFRIGAGVVYDSKEVSPSGDIKWAFWDRYSLTSGLNKNNFELFNLSRHVDDMVRWIKLENLELKAGLGKPYRETGFAYQAGLRVNF